MQHALTVDVEDYYHVSAFADTIAPGDWGSLSSRVEKNTLQLLELFDEHNTRATFFVLGWVAERFPRLVREIAELGHEVASHGYSHQLVYEQELAVFRDEAARSKALLEELTGQPVAGYRAASYSVTRDSLWALDVLVELGYEYDSSIFPVHHDRYGMPGAPARIHRALAPGGGEIVEFPLSFAQLGNWRLPVAGGGYFRLYPYSLTRLLLNKNRKDNSQPFIFYLHPWEIDPEQPRVEGASALSRFRHYLNLHRCEPRLRRLLVDFRFTTVAEVIATFRRDQGLDVYDYGSRPTVSRSA